MMIMDTKLTVRVTRYECGISEQMSLWQLHVYQRVEL